MSRVILIDNYDSFTYNLVHYIGTLGAQVRVIRNDVMSADDVMALQPDAIVLSPGPGTPDDAGICCALIEKSAGRIPLMGVCLGHQAIGQVFGGTVRRAALPMHGKLSTISHESGGVFRGINGNFLATRYHSLVVDEATLPNSLEITARCDDNIIMGLSHKTHPIHGVQFHPESIASEHGHRILQNFLEIAAQFNTQIRQIA